MKWAEMVLRLIVRRRDRETAAARSRRFRGVAINGLLIGVATMAVIYVSSILRINLFLEQISNRADWVNLMARYRASDFHSLRAYANYEYLGSLPVLLALGAVAGGCCGLLGATIRQIARVPSRFRPNQAS
jgi:hypothetical protein